MPKRLVDGERLWRSDKLAQVHPVNFRPEYANLIPLALANGTFECNAKRIWAEVYSYNRPDITLETVEEILKEFERVKLLFRWWEDDKEWGFWVGIDREGLLPSESQCRRYKKGSSPPQNQLKSFLNNNLIEYQDNIQIISRQHPDNIQIISRQHPDNVQQGFGFGLELDGCGSGTESEMQRTPPSHKKIPEICMKELHVDDSAPWYTDELKKLDKIHGPEKVVNGFYEWIQTFGTTRHPIGDYISTMKETSGRIAETGDKLRGLKAKLYTIGNKEFNDRLDVSLTQLLNEYTDDEITSAYYEFTDKEMTEYDTSRAPQNFCEGGCRAILDSRKLAKEEAERAKKMYESAAQAYREAAPEPVEEEIDPTPYF